MNRSSSLALGCGSLALAFILGCGGSASSRHSTSAPGAYAAGAESDSANDAEAIVVLQPTEGNDVVGHLSLEPLEKGVRLTGIITGLAPDSVHAIHVHEHGDCSAPDAESAGGHFDPEHDRHGRARHGEHHLGDMDNLRTDEVGAARVNRVLVHATLGDGGARDLEGRAVIVHASPDDYRSQPSGNAGARIACGVITPS